MLDLVNYGKYAFPIAEGVPAWKTGEGEMAFYANTAGAEPTYRIYVRLGSAWIQFASANSAGQQVGGLPGGPEFAIQSNSASTFYGDTAFLYWRGTGVALQAGYRMIYDSTDSGDTYHVYNTANTYLETYLNGELRLQM